MRAVVAFIAVSISACGGGGGGGGVCQFVGGGASSVTTTVDPACSGCSVSNESAAADQNLGSGATITVSPMFQSNSGVSIRATAQSGVVFPAGSEPRVYFSNANGNLCRELSTYLDGNLQEGGTAFCFSEANGQGYDSSVTTSPFDAVQIDITSNQVSGDIVIDIDELCADK